MRSAENSCAAATSTGERVLAAIFVALGVAMIAIALYLRPDNGGHGTHTQLHLPPCAFRAMSGLPCPACGLTTSIAHMARAEIAAAFDTHPFGIVLFATVIFLAALGANSLLRNRPLTPTLGRLFNNKTLTVMGIGFIAAWLFNLLRCIYGI